MYQKLRVVERKALRAILKLRSGTANDLILHELRRGDIISKIRDRQYKFYRKIRDIPDGEAIVQNVLEICKNDRIIKYYESLHDHNNVDDINEREARIHISTKSLTKYYAEMNFSKISVIYCSFLDDNLRSIITRWRLSNHDLNIQKGRYNSESERKERQERVCALCNVLEDEQHVIFDCKKYNDLRVKYMDLLTETGNIKQFLDPTLENTCRTATFILEVEAHRKK